VSIGSPSDRIWPFSRADLTDFGQTVAELSGIDERVRNVTAVVHLAAIPGAGLATNAVASQRIRSAPINVFEPRTARNKECGLGIQRVPCSAYRSTPLRYVPVDEEYPGRPGISLFAFKTGSVKKWRNNFVVGSRLKIIGLGFSNIMSLKTTPDSLAFRMMRAKRKWNFWGILSSGCGRKPFVWHF